MSKGGEGGKTESFGAAVAASDLDLALHSARLFCGRHRKKQLFMIAV